MVWTTKSCLKLIHIYKEQNILWDVTHPRYYNKIKKNYAWEEIAEALSSTADECRRKMKSLLSALRRERYKIRKSQATGHTDIYESSWFAFESMQFLCDKDKVVKTANITKQEKKDEVEEKHTTETAHALTTHAPLCTPRNKRNSDDTKVDIGFEKLWYKNTRGHQFREQSEAEVFGNLVAKKLEKYSKGTQIAVQEKIMNILFQADKNYFDTCSSQISSYSLQPSPASTNNLCIYPTNSLGQPQINTSQSSPTGSQNSPPSNCDDSPRKALHT